ncbi:MAG: helix-turn-helix transcriptional regulator [Firmicutes bacterium]|nr:helix-turn-helix transcriptional regulator [Bacillota bacterium]
MRAQLSVGEKLIILRGSRSQREVGEAVGVSTAAIGMYERDQRIPKDSVKKRLADFFGTSVQDLFFT